MAIVPQQVNLPFLRSLDTKTDPNQVSIGKLLLTQNGVFTNPNELVKRNGYQQLASLSSGVMLTSFQNQLIAGDGQSLYSYSPVLGTTENVGAAPAIGFSQVEILSSTSQIIQSDWAYDSGSGLSCYVASTGVGTQILIQDPKTEAAIYQVTQQVSSSASYGSRVIVFNGYFVILISSGAPGTGKISAYKIQISAPSSITSIGTVQASNVLWSDCLVSGSRLFVSSTVSGTTKISYIDTSFAVHAGISAAGNYVIPFLSTDASTNVWVYGIVYGGGSAANSDFAYEIHNNALNSVILTTTTADSAVVTSQDDGGMCTASISGTTATFYYGPTCVPNVSDTQYSNQPGGTINTVTGTTAGVVGTPAVLIRSLAVASKPFSFNGSTCLVASYQSALQSSYFVITVSGQILANWANGSAYFGFENEVTDQPDRGSTFPVVGYYNVMNGFPNTNITVYSLGSGQVQIPYLLVDEVTSVSGVVSGQAGINLATLSTGYTPIHSLGGKNVLLSGVIPRVFDGNVCVEQGFLKYPEYLTGTNTGPGGAFGPGASTSAQWQWVATYEWLDAQGQIHRSNPTPVPVTQVLQGGQALTFTGTTTTGSTLISSVSSFSGLFIGQVVYGTGITSGTYIVGLVPATGDIFLSQPNTSGGSGVTIGTKDTNTNYIAVETLRTTSKTNVVISLWRTLANQTTFYRVTTLAAPVFNNAAVDTITVTDNVPDAVLRGNDPLYTTGGVIGNVCLPPVLSSWNYLDRVMAVDAEDGLSTWYSQEIQSGLPLQFNDSFTWPVSELDGPLVTGIEMDGKCILFKERAIYYFVGEGPSPNGSSNDFTLPQRLATDTGCINARSAVLIPTGVLYQSTNGIYLLDRSLQVSYIGWPVEAYNSGTITSALLVPGTTQVRFTFSSGVILMYDYYISQLVGEPQWSVFQNSNGADATIFGGLYTYITPLGSILQETPGSYTDNGAFIPLGLTTSWLSLAGLQGYQRVWEMLVLGTWYSAHNLLVQIAINYNPAIVQTDTIQAGTSLTPYQNRVHMVNQRCQTMQITLTEQQSSPYGQGLSLSGLSFRYAQKTGLNKIPGAQSYG